MPGSTCYDFSLLMDNIQALDVFFRFFPRHLLEKLKSEGLYDPILSGRAKSGSELYDFMSPSHAALQDADYSSLESALEPWLGGGPILQIGCGRGDLLMRLAGRGYAPLFGIDRSGIMLEKARERLKPFDRVHLFQQRVEDFDWSSLPSVDSVLIVNFWGMLPEAGSIDLLNNLKRCISPSSRTFIGPYRDDIKITDELRLAEKTLRENLGFDFAYRFFTNFRAHGYDSKLIKLAGAQFFLLGLKAYDK